MIERAPAPGPLRILLVGPRPPPHGGISIHVATARRLLRATGVQCRVLDSGGHRARGPVGAVASVARLLARIAGHARRGFLLHLHTNGHGVASWCLALGCAVAARRGRGRVLTLHSGLLPDFLEHAGLARRWLARATVARYERVIAVHRRVHDALVELGGDPERLAVLPAHLATPRGAAALPHDVEAWIASRSPVLSSALFFRPEYGFDLLLDAVARLSERHPRLGCVVLGGAGGEDEAAARRRVVELGLGGHVLLTGDVPHQIATSILARSDLFARPARIDGDSISVREALALGVPVVASDASERPEGVVLHRADDPAHLAARLDEVLAAVDRGHPGAASPPCVEEGFETLLWIYRRTRRGLAPSSPRGPRRLAARLERLREMSGREVAFRLRHELRIHGGRILPRASRGESDRDLLLSLAGGAEASCDAPFTRHLREVVAPRFYLPAASAERRAVAELLWRRFPSWLSATAAEAERLCAHRVEILGHGEHDLGPEIDWHRDPVSGAVWPRRHFASYDPLREDQDVKRIHELNRHQHLPRLAKAYWLLGEERYAREVVAQMLGWIEQNPPGQGIHWHSSLEIAIRALQWLWSMAFVLPSQALDEAAALRIGRSLAAQLDHVARHPSVYSSPNTHLIGEAAALYAGGLLFADGARGRAWLTQGADLLSREAERQVLADGLHAELSPYYHCYTVDFYLQALVLGRRCGRPLDRGVWRRVEGLLDALLHLARPDGSVPLLGDDDGGRALALGATHYGDALDLLGAGAVLYGRGDWKRQAGAFREEVFWLLGREGWIEWEALAPSEPNETRARFEHGGYLVERSGWSKSSTHLVFDRGDLGKLGGGHGHADALSVVLAAGGEDLLVDAGTCVYNGAPEWREFFRSTRAHNTVVIDGAEQSIAADTFRWSRKTPARPCGDASHEGVHYAAGEHDGFAQATGGVLHRRRLLNVENGYWLVLDDFREQERPPGSRASRAAAARHAFDVLWHFAPDAELAIDPRSEDAAPGGAAAAARVRSAGLSLHLEASAPLAARIVRGATAPPQGWVSRRYGEKRAAPVLEARFVASVPAACVTLLAPWRQARRSRAAAPAHAVPVAVEGDPRGGAVALAVAHPRGEDLVILAAGAVTVSAGPCRARAEALWLRIEDGRLVRLFAAGATAVDFRGERVIESVAPIDHFWSAPRGRATITADIVEEPLHVRHRRDR